jgi:DNA-binding CsgD family transcriptional regulator
MSESAPTLRALGTLRVAIVATDLRVRAELIGLLSGAAPAVVDTMDEADVVLCAAEVPRTDKPLVTIGAIDRGQAAALPSHASPAQVDAALRAAAAGLTVRAAEELARGFGAARERSVDTLLTPRELEILAAIAEGSSNKTIAQRFGISLHTVKFHVESLFRKLGARTRAEAVAKGLDRRREEMEI